GVGRFFGRSRFVRTKPVALAGASAQRGGCAAASRDSGDGPGDLWRVEVGADRLQRQRIWPSAQSSRRSVVGAVSMLRPLHTFLAGLALFFASATLPSPTQAQGRGYLGVDLQDLTAARAGELRREIAQGALVVGARPGSPAQRAGLRADDIIIEADGVATETIAAPVSYIRRRRRGSALKLVVWRDGKRLALTATVGRMPATLVLMQQIEALTSDKKYAQAIALAERLAAATKADPGPRSSE